MLIFALVFFLLAASLGIYLLTYLLQDKNTPKGVAMIHGSLGAIGLVLLALVSYYHPFLFLYFCLVALGGFTLMYLDITRKKIPHLLAYGHGLLALCGVAALIYILLQTIGNS